MGKKTKNKKKKVTNSKVGFNQKVPEKERVFADVRLYRIMPIVFLVGVLLLVTGIGLFWKTGHDYKIAQGKKSMPYGTQLPILSGSSDRGVLTLGNSILSKDKKHLAVEIKYDDTAHQYLSAFAKNSFSSIPASLNDLGIFKSLFNFLISSINEFTPSSFVYAGKFILLDKSAYFWSAIKYSYLGNDTNFVGI